MHSVFVDDIIQMMHGSEWILKYVTWLCVIIMINDHVTVYNYNDTRSTVTRWSYDNDQRHVTAFRPISEAAHSWSCDNIQMMHGVDIEIWWTKVENVARGRSLSATFATEGHHISMSHERPCFICFVVWPSTSLKLYIVFWDGGETRVSIVWHLKMHTDLITVRG